MPFLHRHAKSLCLLAVLAAGILITSPDTNFQNFLSQGDHGRDLYAADAVFRGERPYRDFWWVYGPFMPYYYGLFFKVLGTKITSMITGKLILRISGGLLICLGMMEVSSLTASFLCACWFMLFQDGFFFTYNHLGGIVMEAGAAFCLLSYIRKSSLKAAWGALAFIFVLCLIKVNFGLAALAVSLISIAVCDFTRRVALDTPKKYFYAAALIALPLTVFMIYWSLLKGLSVMEIRQCLPYKEGDQPFSTTPWTAIWVMVQSTWHTIKTTWMNLIFAVIINASALRCLYLFGQDTLPSERKKILGLSLGMLCLFYTFNTHEYLKSGVWYRYYWAQPLSMMIFFLLIDVSAQSFTKTARKLIFTLIAILAMYCWFTNMRMVNTVKTDSHFLPLPRAGVYISNAPQWTQTVEQTTAFLNKTLKPDELFFALPYDCLYYFLTGKRTPTRQLIFFEHIKIPPQQERSVIAELEKNHVHYVLLSNRAFARQELGLGYLGTNYCPLIWKYIQDNFVPLARFGDWTQEPGWAWNHGTLILKRKGP
jgi:hypothetical protein